MQTKQEKIKNFSIHLKTLTWCFLGPNNLLNIDNQWVEGLMRILIKVDHKKWINENTILIIPLLYSK
jgi:hypothetical protein